MARTRLLDLLVIAGGRSAERDVSCISAAAILRNADKKRYRVRLVHIDKNGRWLLEKKPAAFARHPRPDRYPFQGKPVSLELGKDRWLHAGGKPVNIDAVFPALHGPMGEDGTVQGLFELAQVPYVGSDVFGSAVGMDKAATKKLAALAGLPILPYAVVNPKDSLASALKLKFPVFVKPSRLGSSVGVYKVRRSSQLKSALRRAFRFDTTALVEQGVDPREVECALLGEGLRVEASVVGEIRPNADFYSYNAKYLDPHGAEILVPAQLPKEKSDEVRRLAVLAFKALGCYGLARADFLLDKKSGKLWFNEINTLPGFTSVSLYPRLWGASGITFPRLIDRLVALALSRQRAKARLRVTP